MRTVGRNAVFTIPKRSLMLPPDFTRISSLVDSNRANLAVDHGLEARATTGKVKVNKTSGSLPHASPRLRRAQATTNILRQAM